MKTHMVVASWVSTLLVTAAHAASVGTAFTYQGQLVKNGQPVNNTCDLRFSAFDAAVAGNLEGGPTTISGLVITDGVLTTTVDLGPGVFFGEARWLLIELKCIGDAAFVALNPRQELKPAPYAIGLSLPFKGEAAEPGNVIEVINTGGGRAGNFQIANPANPEAAVNALSNGSGPAGSFLNDGSGNALEATVFGNTNAVQGTSPFGAGVYGENTGTGGAGVRGVHASGTGAEPGVLGETNSSNVDAVGVLGRLNSAIPGLRSAGVRGFNHAIGPNGYGVYGEHASEGSGVYGTAPDRFGDGVMGESQNGTGVRGLSHSSFDNTAGVFGGATAPLTARGIETYGVYGESHAVDGTGVKGVHVSGIGPAAGVAGSSQSSESGAVGVLGEATATSGATRGVQGDINSPSGFAGYFTGPAGSQNYFQRNVGIGTTDPNHELVVQGDDPAAQIRDDTTDNSAEAARLELLERAGGAFDGGAFFWWNGEDNKLLIGTKSAGTNTNVLVIDRATGSVGIGTQNPGNYRLAVNGPVRAKEIVVETGWSDFVFEADYELKSLEEVESHIQKHGHLPDIPSAREIAEHGVKVGEMESKLLQKIEELTLHLIEMDKRVIALERENAQLSRSQGLQPHDDGRSER